MGLMIVAGAVALIVLAAGALSLVMAQAGAAAGIVDGRHARG